ncbi:MAG: restriction endonuclease [Chloroflexi bacterium]|nr:restriction endonuclease [Chloroflexota bacterium]
MPGRIESLRRAYHRQIANDVLRQNASGVPNNADSGSASSVRIARGIVQNIGLPLGPDKLAGQTAGRRFEKATKVFLRDAFGLLSHLRPGEWDFSLGGDIRDYEQYLHLSDVRRMVKQHEELRIIFGDYIVTPDIVVCREPVSDSKINENEALLNNETVASHTPLRRANSQASILHASVSCKWTIRSDRSQNARTEGLNLVRNRKGKTPHIVVVIGEPLPGRIASLAYGTGDIDCIYHFALRELTAAVAGNDSDAELLDVLVKGRRLRDISDLPFDLAT